MPSDLTLLLLMSRHRRVAVRASQGGSVAPVQSTPAPPPTERSLTSLPDPRLHSPVCCCLLCEQAGTGEQAMRSAGGDYERFFNSSRCALSASYFSVRDRLNPSRAPSHSSARHPPPHFDSEAAMTERSTCLRCGGHTVRPWQRPARTVSYRVFAALPIPADLPIPTCSRCQAEFLDQETTHRLHELLPQLYEAELRRRAGQEIRVLAPYISQRKLELLLGISQAYLSRLLTQAGNPSAVLVLLLGLIARDPQARLNEVQSYWQVPRPEPPLLGVSNATHPLR